MAKLSSARVDLENIELDWGDIATKAGALEIVDTFEEESGMDSTTKGLRTRLSKRIYKKCVQHIKRLAKEVGYTHLLIGCDPWEDIPSTMGILCRDGMNPETKEMVKYWRFPIFVVAAAPDISWRELGGYSGMPVIWTIVETVSRQSPLNFNGSTGNGHTKTISPDTLPEGRWILKDGKWEEQTYTSSANILTTS